MVEFVTYPELLDYIREEFDENLQCVAYSQDEKAKIMFIRDDVDSLYTQDDFAAIARREMGELETIDEKEDVYEVGDVHCLVRVFEKATLFLIPVDDEMGLYVAVDAGTDIPNPVTSFVEGCLERIDDHRNP